jgi:hypothetical protein
LGEAKGSLSSVEVFIFSAFIIWCKSTPCIKAHQSDISPFYLRNFTPKTPNPLKGTIALVVIGDWE